MKSDEALAYIPLLKAHAEGKLQYQDQVAGKWLDCTLVSFLASASCYRRKPELKYIPLTVENCTAGDIVRSKNDPLATYLVTGSRSNGVNVGVEFLLYAELLENYTFLDGSPCGTIEQ